MLFWCPEEQFGGGSLRKKYKFFHCFQTLCENCWAFWQYSLTSLGLIFILRVLKSIFRCFPHKINSLFIKLFYWAELFLSKPFRRFCEFWIPSVRRKSLVTRIFLKKIQHLRTWSQNFLVLCSKFFNGVNKTALNVFNKKFSKRSFSKNSLFIQKFGILNKFFKCFWQIFFGWIAKTASYVSVGKVWKKLFFKHVIIFMK